MTRSRPSNHESTQLTRLTAVFTLVRYLSADSHARMPPPTARTNLMIVYENSRHPSLLLASSLMRGGPAVS